jgi:hypothetical protein
VNQIRAERGLSFDTNLGTMLNGLDAAAIEEAELIVEQLQDASAAPAGAAPHDARVPTGREYYERLQQRLNESYVQRTNDQVTKVTQEQMASDVKKDRRTVQRLVNRGLLYWPGTPAKLRKGPAPR